MRIALLALATTALVSISAQAADKPVTVPVPAWVKPEPIPATKPEEQVAVQLLLSDQQIAFEKGKTSTYSATAMRINKPEGLSVGNISFAWDPERQTPLVHKLLIHRGDKVIDVLGSGQTFTVIRRETNLEAAMLDGVLTANIQPEDLQVGDVVEFTATLESVDPVLKDHVEALNGGWNGLPIAKAHMRMQWPSSMPLRLRTSGDLPKLQVIKQGAFSTAELTLNDLKPYRAPKGAPARYGVGRLVEATDYASWADLGAAMAPLYVKAAVIPGRGALRDEVEKLKAASADPRVRAEAALRLVQERVRYVALMMGAGGLEPASAEATWGRRYGDCKAKTALLLGLLHALDIQAEPVVVNSAGGDGLDARQPAAALFDHVLVRATLAGRTYWLDGTRAGDRSLDRLSVPDVGWGLPLLARGAALVRLAPPPLDRPGVETAIRIDASSGLTTPAPVTIEQVLRGDHAVRLNGVLASLSGEDRDRGLREYWRAQYDFIEVKETAADVDLDGGETRITMRGLATMDWSSGQYQTDGTRVGYKADFQREPGPDIDAPYAVPYPLYNKVTETIVLPAAFSSLKNDGDDDVDEIVAGLHYQRQTKLEGSTFTVTKTERSVAPEFAAKDAVAAQARLRELAKNTVWIKQPKNYAPTVAELDAAIAAKPNSAAAYIDRGIALLNDGKYDPAIADLTKAIALAPDSPWALANRAMASVWKEDHAAATKDLAAAEALDPKNKVVFRARGLMAEQQGRYKDAVAAYDRSLALDASSEFTIDRRIKALKASGDDEGALRDAAAQIARKPHAVDMYLLRANIFRTQKREADALAEAAALARANPDNAWAQVTAARIYGAFDKHEDARRAFDRALAIKPEAYIYLNRALERPRTDLPGQRADFDAALKLDPKNIEVLLQKAKLQRDAAEFDGALATYSTAIAAEPKMALLTAERGVAYLRANKPDLATKDFDAAKALAKGADDLNALCWSKATGGVALERALGECDAALAQRPDDIRVLDSRGLVLLRLDRLDEAIKSYDAVLSRNPHLSYSLYGRALARARKGDAAGAEADRKAALAADADVAEDFADMGLKAQLNATAAPTL